MSVLCTCGTAKEHFCVLHNYTSSGPTLTGGESHGCRCTIENYSDGTKTVYYCLSHDSKTYETLKGGTKYDQEKPRMDLLSREALVQIAQVLTFGAKKYDAHNWRKGLAWSRVLGAALRHLTAFNDGEDKDSETGLSHLAHLGCCVMFLLEYEKTHKELDDRFKNEEK